jgi:hypothetical protein
MEGRVGAASNTLGAEYSKVVVIELTYEYAVHRRACIGLIIVIVIIIIEG